MLDFAHSLVLRGVDAGDRDDSPALQRLVATGLVERLPGGGLAVTAAGRVALADDQDDEATWAAPEIPWIVAGLLGFLTLVFVVVNLFRGGPLLNETQLSSLLLAGIGFALWIVYVRRAARRAQAARDRAGD
jgi:hypothetical protein